MQVGDEGVHLRDVGLDPLLLLKKIVDFPLVDWHRLGIERELHRRLHPAWVGI